jgi:hypothetical protein
MRTLGLALIVSCVAFVGTSAFASDADVLKQFGILGTLAIDCSAPVSKDNAYLTFAVDGAGQATRTVKNGTAIDATLKIRNVSLVRSDLLVFEETGRSSELRVSFAKIDGKYRGWHTVRTSGAENGTVLVDNGVSKTSGKPTVAFTFCHAN